MPPLLILAAFGAGAVIGYRVLKAALDTQSQDDAWRPDCQTESSEPKDLGSLVLDAESGVYKPRT